MLEAGLSVAVERWLPGLRDPEYAYRARALKQRIAAAVGHPPVVVILGSSRTVVGLKAADLQAQVEQQFHHPLLVFNFGMTGAGPLTELLDLRRMLAEGIHPDLLLVEVMPPFLAGQPHARHIELGRLPASRLWRRELAFLDNYGLCNDTLRKAWWRVFFNPWYERRLAILSRVMPTSLPQQLRLDSDRRMDGSGWIPQMAPPSPAFYLWAVEHTHQEYAPYFSDFQIGDPAVRATREILELCRQQHIATGLLLMPEGGPFRSWYSAETWKQVRGFLDGLSLEFETPVICARDWLPDHYFFDSHHLAAPGAAELTLRLGQDETFLGLMRARVDRSVSQVHASAQR
jgi:hypothetical protein